ncbi:MAG: VWA domain-containing protein [Gemmatimonadaceae bacterium]
MTPSFDLPWMLAVAPLLALGAVVVILAGHRARQARLANFGTPEAIQRLGPPEVARPPVTRAVRLGLALGLLGIAVAGPRWGAGTAIIETDGIDLAIALDVSLSMLAEDDRPSRLERMKREVRRLRASAPGDRVALLAFAGRSYILSPLTSDDGALELFLENLDPTIVGQAGSEMAPPLRQGIDLLSVARGGADRALVVMSDGEAFDDRDAALALAREARAKGIHLVTVGFGTPGGAPIPLPETGGAEVKRDRDGAIVTTRYEDALLRDLAAAAEGEFIPAEATDKGPRARRALAELETVRRNEELRLNRAPRYQWFLALAIVLLLLDALFADGARVPRWLGRWRRRAAVVPRLALAVVGGTLTALVPHFAAAQAATLREAIEHHRAGRLLPAIRAYRSVIAGGDRRSLVLYDLGTALLAADSLDAAIETLERATFTPDAEVRRRARYNLGVAYLTRGLRLDGEARSSALQSARRELRTVLLERPGDRDAQWNYELALRVPQGGGGGGGGPPPPPDPNAPPPPSRQMSRQQAEALLDASAREERATQARRQRGNSPTRAAGARDW